MKHISICLVIMVCFTFSHVQAQNLQSLLQDRGLIICVHRAAVNPDITENSISAMKIANKKGFIMHEIDLRESGDGELFLLHDRTLDRTTTATGYLSDYTSEVLAEVRLIGSDEQLPAFSHALAWAKANGIILMLDVKDANLQKVHEEVVSADMLDKVFLLTFTEELSRQALALDPNLMVSVRISNPEDIQVFQKYAQNPDQLLAYVNRRADPELFRVVRESGIPIITDTLREIDRQALVEGPVVYQQFLSERMPDIVVSDYPVAVRKAMQEKP